MTLKKELNLEREQEFENLKGVWSELDKVRGMWIENPSSPVLTDRLRQQEEEAGRMEERFRRVYQRLYGSWLGIEE